ncbi:ABC transporter ATP-binding protein [Hydrogenophaga sp.]|uniref:ABC transporter ATP-binding protein n=1 Tax=Hydrogenophaga sp. TaxID=1904254 RepID=UPI0035675395
MSQQPSLRVRGLVKRFGGLLATDHVDLDVFPNGIHALIGPNGAGKTTLVHQLAGSLLADEGRIEFMGRDMARMPMHKRVLHGVARSHQLTNIFGGYSVLHNILLAVQARSGSSFRFTGSPFDEPALIEEAMVVVDLVGLKGAEMQTAKALSYGEQRRVEIAIALATQPKLLLLDEPLAGMGSTDAAAIVGLIEQLKQRTTIVLIEHDMGAVFRLADQISVLVYGQVIATDTPSAIRSSSVVRSAYLGDETP